MTEALAIINLTYLGTGVAGVILNAAKDQAGATNLSNRLLADNTVFHISIATVIGPTPPGTGVT